MQKAFYYFILSLFFSLSTLSAVDFDQYPLGTERTVLKKFIFGNEWIFVLDDNSCWVVRIPPLESRTWSEWWNSVEHSQPDQKYYFDIKKWPDNPVVIVYEYVWDQQRAEELFKGNKNEAKSLLNYPYLIQDIRTGETAFAKYITGAELASNLLKHASSEYDRGYSNGYSNGRHAGYSDGYTDGYKEGYSQGQVKNQNPK